MTQQRWFRIIPVALVMYSISYVDRTNVSLALDPEISSMMKDLFMDDRMKGEAAGVFFLGYVLLQIPGGHWATRWSPRKLISLLLVAWGIFAVGCGLSRGFRQFEVMRFLLGAAESGVFPATLVLLANWFPSGERARATALWTLCQPLAIVGSAPVTAWLLGRWGWQRMLICEGFLPLVWLPLWWFCIRDYPREAKGLSASERNFLESALRKDAAKLETAGQNESILAPGITAPSAEAREPATWLRLAAQVCCPAVLVLVAMYFLQNCAAYGCMTFFTTGLKGQGFSPVTYGILFALPYALTAIIMLVNSWHSDRTRERRGHVALVYVMSGVSLILAVKFSAHFWLSYALICLAIPAPFAAMGPFWAVPGEILPRNLMGLAVGVVNAFGNLGGSVGPYLAGWLKQEYHSTAVPFTALGLCLVAGAILAFLLPKRTGPATIEA